MTVRLAPRAPRDDLAAADWLREAVRPALTLLFVLQQAVAHGGHDPAALRRGLDAAISAIHLDDRARARGLGASDLRRVRLALIAAADELTQRPSSRCDYSRAPLPGEPALLQQKHAGHTSAGSHFSDELAALLAAPRLGAGDVAVLEFFATCLALGVRGRHEPGPELDAVRARTADRLAPLLTPPDLPPARLPPPVPPPVSPSRLLPLLALLLVLFSAALVLAARAGLARDADLLLHDLAALRP